MIRVFVVSLVLMMKTYLKKKWQSWRGTVMLITFVILPIKSSVASLNFVPTGSMNPTILEGDFVFSNLLSYDLRIPFTDYRINRWDDPGPGDIVICFSPDDDVRLVKRVIGIPGDQIEMRQHKVFINGEALEYEPLDYEVLADMNPTLRDQSIFATEHLGERKHAVMAMPGLQSNIRSFEKRTLGSGEYFVMGDNRDNSKDSRIFGIVPRDEIVGEATHVVLSFDITDKLQPRWKRFFTELK